MRSSRTKELTDHDELVVSDLEMDKIREVRVAVLP